jgi:hypothetical protein
MAQVVTCLASNPKSSSSTPVLLKKKKKPKMGHECKRGTVWQREPEEWRGRKEGYQGVNMIV